MTETLQGPTHLKQVKSLKPHNPTQSRKEDISNNPKNKKLKAVPWLETRIMELTKTGSLRIHASTWAFEYTLTHGGV